MFSLAAISMLLSGSVDAAKKPNTAYQDEEVQAQLFKKFADGEYSKKGADSCLKCHDADSDFDSTQIFAGPHGSLNNPHSPMAKLQCESCHGPIGRHDKRPRKGKVREPMISFSAQSPLTANQKSSVCLSCHEDHNRMNWSGSQHELNELACSDCHKVHNKHDPITQKVQQNETCMDCHRKQHVEVQKRSSHPLKFDRQVCTDCHNPHDSSNDASLITATINENCYSCHAEKRGPFLWEHDPVQESCTNCHSPHGSNNAMLLKRRGPQLCQECHTAVGHTSAAYVNFVGDKVQAKNCLNCHSKIHGSHRADGDLFQN